MRGTTVLQTLLKGQRNENVDINWSKRPDLVIGSDFTVSSTCIEEADENEIFVISKVLIIELKKVALLLAEKKWGKQKSMLIVFTKETS